MTRKLAFHCVNASLSLRFAIARMYRSARRTFASHLRVSAASFASRARFASTSSAHSTNAFATALRVMRCTHRRYLPVEGAEFSRRLAPSVESAVQRLVRD